MIATNVMMNTTPPRTPPMTGARGNFLPPSFESFCIRLVGEDRPLGDGELSNEVEGIKLGVVVGIPKGVGDWRTKVRMAGTGRRNLDVHRGIS